MNLGNNYFPIPYKLRMFQLKRVNSIDKGQNWNNNNQNNNNVKGKSYSWNKKKNVVNDGIVDTPKPKQHNVINLTNDIQTTK